AVRPAYSRTSGNGAALAVSTITSGAGGAPPGASAAPAEPAKLALATISARLKGRLRTNGISCLHTVPNWQKIGRGALHPRLYASDCLPPKIGKLRPPNKKPRQYWPNCYAQNQRRSRE